MIDYDGRRFRAVANTANGETSADTIFQYRQSGNLISAEYSGGSIVAAATPSLHQAALELLDRN